eukprot:CAMPEP_0116880862 /NCGR_PEP_ID=MMETSP0463-20121206/12876_1 /TAXON_ID=181622 /ORGANISM="Strombidinopsis sp, Strain SopsisLIS2011" /LENGTH=121 /DNA_ID=CAMNT_0004532035 /DNA_START=1324 /DNA_END=1689 /DNA_ORIENTATION=+
MEFIINKGAGVLAHASNLVVGDKLKIAILIECGGNLNRDGNESRQLHIQVLRINVHSLEYLVFVGDLVRAVAIVDHLAAALSLRDFEEALGEIHVAVSLVSSELRGDLDYQLVIIIHLFVV